VEWISLAQDRNKWGALGEHVLHGLLGWLRAGVNSQATELVLEQPRSPGGGRMTHTQAEKMAETNRIFGWQTACRWQDMSRGVNTFATRWLK